MGNSINERPNPSPYHPEEHLNCHIAHPSKNISPDNDIP
uniref:Uncharacterized protein n=1 Tax=Arundo donax TaxID=35708 RepID=A0A0A8Z159_ARUDO